MAENVSDKQIRRAIAAIAKTTIPALKTFPRWDAAFTVTGQSLNAARGADGKIKALFATNAQGVFDRIGDVQHEDETGFAYARTEKPTYIVRLLYSYDDAPDGNGETSEDHHADAMDALQDAFGLSPKLGLGTRIERADELQLKQKTLFQFGADLVHVADFTLTVHKIKQVGFD